jgi:hypothetical protein
MLGAFALLIAPDVSDAAKDKGPKATFIKGDVEHGPSAEGPFKRLKKKRKVPVGNFVKTGDGARAELKFPDGSVVRMGPSSILHVSASGFNGKTKEVKVEANVVGGKVWANVSKMVGSEAKFQVKTENAVAGVRGTVFRVNLDQDKATVVKVYNGAVAVSNSPFFANQSADDSAGVGPIRKDRVQIAAPYEKVNKKEFEEIVERMMVVRVGADGAMSKPQPFTLEDEKKDKAEAEWINWNLSCDQGSCSDF